MEKRIFYVFFITLLFLIGWNYFISKYFPQQPSSSFPSHSIKEEKIIVSEEDLSKEENLLQAEIGNFVVTYSPRRGYVKKILIKRYNEELSFQNIGITFGDENENFTSQIEKNKLIFTSPTGRKKIFSFQDYILKITFTSSPSQLLLFSTPQIENRWDARYQEFFYKKNNVIYRKYLRKIKEKKYEKITFAGARDRYYCISLLKNNYNIKWKRNKNKAYFYLITPPKEISLYLGPQIEKELRSFGLEEIIYYGFSHGIGVIMIKFLYLFYSFTKNWGISIIFLSFLIYLVLFPFTMKSTKAMKKMQEIQPEILELKKKYKDNPQKLNKEIIELYRKYNINPLGGCLPVFFQLPVFFALYQVLFRFVEIKGAPFLWIKDLSLPDRFLKLPFPPFLNYLNILPLFLIITGFLQQKLFASSPSSEQKSMSLFIIVFFGVIFYNFPSSLVLYWLTQNILNLFYQIKINKLTPVSE
jgi:YidC/Oxa1 family membrane protein insertase